MTNIWKAKNNNIYWAICVTLIIRKRKLRQILGTMRKKDDLRIEIIELKTKISQSVFSFWSSCHSVGIYLYHIMGLICLLLMLINYADTLNILIDHGFFSKIPVWPYPHYPLIFYKLNCLFLLICRYLYVLWISAFYKYGIHITHSFHSLLIDIKF